MENFDIAKYLKEHSLGSYGMFNGYVDIKPLKEEETEIPYKGHDHLTGNGEGDKFKQAETLPEEMDVDGELDYDRMMDLGGEHIEQGIIGLLSNGVDPQDILDICNQLVKAHAAERG